MTFDRRRFGRLGGRLLTLFALVPFAGSLKAAGDALARTPSEPEGPYYPPHTVWPAVVGPNLRGGDDGRPRADGQAIDLVGIVVDTRGAPMADVEIEIWQTDGRGHYLHPDGMQSGTDGPRDPAFAGFGRATTDAQGRYRIETIVPVAYSSRPPHFHVKLGVAGRERLTTQLYLPGQTQERGLFSRLTGDRTWGTDRSLLTLALDESQGSTLRGRFRFVL